MRQFGVGLKCITVALVVALTIGTSKAQIYDDAECNVLVLADAQNLGESEAALAIGWYLVRRGCAVVGLAPPELESLCDILGIGFGGLERRELGETVVRGNRSSETGRHAEHYVRTEAFVRAMSVRVDEAQLVRELVGERRPFDAVISTQTSALLTAITGEWLDQSLPLRFVLVSEPTWRDEDREVWRTIAEGSQESITRARRDVFEEEGDTSSSRLLAEVFDGASGFVETIRTFDATLTRAPAHVRDASLFAQPRVPDFGSVPSGLEEFVLDDAFEKRPICVHLDPGVGFHRPTPGLLRTLLRAFAKAQARVVFSRRGWEGAFDSLLENDDELLGFVRANVKTYGRATSHEWLFEQCTVVVVDSSSTSVHMAAHSARPLVVVDFPEWSNARVFPWAQQADALTIAVQYVGEPTVDTLASVVEHFLNNDIAPLEQHALELADRLRENDGAARIGDHVLSQVSLAVQRMFARLHEQHRDAADDEVKLEL